MEGDGPPRLRRRELLAGGAAAAGWLALGPSFLRDALAQAAPAQAGESPYGPLQPADGNGLMLPPGFRSRLIARGKEPVAETGYVWSAFSDGQATFPAGDGGWILVTNFETHPTRGGGAGAVRFDADGSIASAYRILGGTSVNCGGGPAPWGAWLSCEEIEGGRVWECDPAGVREAVARPAMGIFKHEAVAVDPAGRRLYLTEDQKDGCLYRFTPDTYPDLAAGTLEVAVVEGSGTVGWREIPDPGAAGGIPTRMQVPEATRFNGGEGIWYDRGTLYFTTKGDRRVWAYDAVAGRVDVLFDRSLAKDSALDAVDNVTVSSFGDVYVCEDGGNMEIATIASDRTVAPFLRFTGPEHAVSEVCGAAFDPSGTRLYLTSQGAFPSEPGVRGPGAVYEVSGPFRLPAAAAPQPAAPPAGKGAAGPGPGPDTGTGTAEAPPRPRPRLRARAGRTVARRRLLTRGLGVIVQVDRAATVTVALRTGDLAREPGRGGSADRPLLTTLARSRRSLPGGQRRVIRLEVGQRARARIRRRPRAIGATITVVARDAAGSSSVLVRDIRIGAGRSG